MDYFTTIVVSAKNVLGYFYNHFKLKKKYGIK